VSDLIDGFLRMMESPAEFTGPVNLGNPNEFTIMELAQKTIAMTGGKARLGASRPLPPDDPKQRKPDITLARARLGWEPTVQLAEGLQRTIDWMKSVDLSDFRAPTPNY
jgi:UDP-glucuronate decarboxylase